MYDPDLFTAAAYVFDPPPDVSVNAIDTGGVLTYKQNETCLGNVSIVNNSLQPLIL